MINDHPFFEHIRAQHPTPENFDAFLAACNRPLRKSIRVNTLKISVADFRCIADNHNWLLSPIPWCEEGFWISAADENELSQLGNCGEHLMGLFYIQEASSMLPPIALLKDNPSTLVLDVAAAPGSKTTQLAALMDNQGTILANELSASRLKVLHANLQRCGVTNTCMGHYDGTQLDKNLIACFDSILLDAPCGGEGTYRKDPKALDNWSLSAIESISNLQKQLLLSAWKMLKPGGRIVYSTCTLSRAENQDVIKALKDEVADELSIIPLKELFPEASHVVTDEGFIHVWPEVFDCEGFFVACLEKKKSNAIAEVSKITSESPFKRLNNKTSQLIKEYYQQQFDFDLSPLLSQLRLRVSQRENQVWLFPEYGEKLRQSLRLQRSGIRVCDLIDSRKGTIIKTCHEFVICFGTTFSKQFVELNATQAVACYKGNNIQDIFSTKLTMGEAVMSYKGVPLGLAKVLNTGSIIKLKNNLPRDLLRTNARF